MFYCYLLYQYLVLSLHRLFIHIIVPGFPEEKMMQAVALSRVMFLGPIFLTASAVLGGVLVSFRRFWVYSTAPIFYNLGIIIGVKIFAPHMGVIGLAWGVVLGSFMHFVVHVIAVRPLGFRFRLPLLFSYRNPDVIQTMRLMVPRMFSSASNQLSLIFVSFFALLLLQVVVVRFLHLPIMCKVWC